DNGQTHPVPPDARTDSARLYSPQAPQTLVQLIRGHYTSVSEISGDRQAPSTVADSRASRDNRPPSPVGGGLRLVQIESEAEPEAAPSWVRCWLSIVRSGLNAPILSSKLGTR